MRIIFSRKGFDSAAGGVASPILHDGTMLSLPIPDRQSPIRYDQIRLHGHDIGKVVKDLTNGRIDAAYRAHLDPDLVPDAMTRKSGWHPIFGQAGGDQTVLEHADVARGDLFLFFGWFREAAIVNGAYRFIRGAPDIHALWGWLEVENVVSVATGAVPRWADYHPHVAAPTGRTKNTIYIGRGETFKHFHDGLRLTAAGRGRSVWSLPAWFHPGEDRPPLGYHTDRERWVCNGTRTLLTTVARGQEFVLNSDHYPEAAGWVASLRGNT